MSPETSDDREWVRTDPDWRPAETLALDRLDLLDEVVHPIRGAILRRLRRPHTVAELAEALDAPVTRLYHHVNRLEAEGLIRIDATRRAGGVIERRYVTTARRFDLDPDRIDPSDGVALGRAIGGVFDLAKSSLQREFELGELDGGELDRTVAVTLAALRLDDARRDELLARLGALVTEFADEFDDVEVAGTDTTSRRRYTLFLAAFPESG